VNLQTTLGWGQGELNFYNQPLGAVVADLNRYSSSPITIDGDELRLIPITGVARTDGILEWLQALASVMNFEVVQHSDRTVLRTSYARAKGSVAIQSGASDKNAGAHVRH
jgi:transmembrane sensor